MFNATWRRFAIFDFGQWLPLKVSKSNYIFSKEKLYLIINRMFIISYLSSPCFDHKFSGQMCRRLRF